MRLTVLGSQGTWPGASRECCGYLLSADGFNLWLDAGTGTFARLQEHLPVAELGGLLISHGHADHFLDIIPAFYARHYGGQGAPGLPVPLARRGSPTLPRCSCQRRAAT